MHGLLASVSGRIADRKRQIAPLKWSEIFEAELGAAAGSTGAGLPRCAAEVR